MNQIKFILFISLFFAAVAPATAAGVERKVEYAQSLNSMASVLMGWYGSLLPHDGSTFVVTPDIKWNESRTHYPNKITGLKITQTDLVKLAVSEYAFNVQSKITYLQDDVIQAKQLDETFVFHITPSGQAILDKKTRNKEQSVIEMSLPTFDYSYYQKREFAYTWLAYLDGVNTNNSIKGKDWFNTAVYTVKMGTKKIEGSILSTLAERNPYLSKGRHTLRSIEGNTVEGRDNTFILDLIINWKGVNAEGKTVLAKIHQTITYELKENNTWYVTFIKEEHLLPDIGPWQNLLC
ncbi:MAG: hypothetical protein WBC60_16320 [Cognaticolwellia sp.]